jgi:hypothetical protein
MYINTASTPVLKLCTATNTWTQVGSGGSGITGLTGDGSASGTGSVALILSTVNSTPGACGDATHVCQTTTNAKGLVTAQSQVAITGGGGGYNPLDPTTVYIVQEACGASNVDNGTGSFFQVYGGNNNNCQSAPSADDLSYYQSNTGATTNNQTHYTYVPGLGGIFTPATFKSPKFYYRGSISAVTSVYYAVGWGDSYAIGDPLNDFIGIKYDTAVPDTDYRCVIIAGGTIRANVDTGVAATTGFHTFKLDSASGSITCTIDGTAVAATGTFQVRSSWWPQSLVQTLSNTSINLNTAWAAFSVSGLVR